MMQLSKNPLELEWELAGELCGDDKSYYIMAMADGKAWIILKSLVRSLADHIIKVHNEALPL